MNDKLALFKHLQAKYADSLLQEGVLRVGTLLEYQKIENDEIRDNREGNTTHKYAPTKAELFTVEMMKQAPRELSGLFQPAPGATNANIIMMPVSSITTHRTVPNCYIYCLSRSSAKNVFEGYDACVEILDIHKFQEVLKENIAQLKELKGLCVKSASIQYIGRDFKSGTYPDPVFVKEETFKGNEEFRIAFQHESFSAGKIEALIIKDARVRELVKRVY